MIRVYRDPSGGWWIDRNSTGVYPPELRNGPMSVDNLDELEDEIASRIRVLLFVDTGVTLDNVGKRISDGVFWLYFEDE